VKQFRGGKKPGVLNKKSIHPGGKRPKATGRGGRGEGMQRLGPAIRSTLRKGGGHQVKKEKRKGPKKSSGPWVYSFRSENSSVLGHESEVEADERAKIKPPVRTR